MILKKHSAHIDTQGKLSLYDNVAFKQNCLNLKDSEVWVTVEKKKKHRSGGQNRYFHAVICVMFGELMGCSADEAKDTLKFEFLRKPLECGKWTIRQTSDLSTVEFEEFCSKCRMLGSQMFGAYIPEPNECEY
jgi:hypothetical protein